MDVGMCVNFKFFFMRKQKATTTGKMSRTDTITCALFSTRFDKSTLGVASFEWAQF